MIRRLSSDEPPGPLEVAPGDFLTGDRWWGWGGEGEARPRLSPAARDLLRGMVGVRGDARAAVPLERVDLPEPALSSAVRERLRALVGEEHVLDDRASRVARAGGKSYEDLVRLRSGDGSAAPDAVVRPGSHDEVAAVLAACAEARLGVVPFGGGTSVVGGVDATPRAAEAAGLEAIVSLDLGRLDRLLHVDARSLTVTFEAGLGGARAEALLAGQGLTLGHFPQSFEHATIGGYLVTRSAGQASTGYGRFESLVRGLRCATPAGDIRVDPFPATAAGPSLRELLVGSEGAFGVVTEATLAVRPRPAARRYEGWSFPTFAAGLEAFRGLAQTGPAPDVARLSDPAETALALAQSAAGGGMASHALQRYLRLRGHRRGCLAVVGYEGEPDEVRGRARRAAGVIRSHGAVRLGAAPGRAWARSRFEGPYLRDDLLDLGILVETLETATTWSRLDGLYRAVREALERALAAQGTPPIVGCHVSHVYGSGASLYFTVLARAQQEGEIEQWRAAKQAAGDAIVAAGGTITHHHAVGTAHRDLLEAEIGAVGIASLRAVKERLDPAGIMNPGKLLPPAA